MAVLIDAYASSPWYADHVRPIMDALRPDAGTLYGPADRRAMASGANPVLTVSYGDHALVRRLGRRHLALGQHGVGQSYLGPDGLPLPNPSYPGGKNQDDVGLFLVPNETAARFTRWRYPRARIAVVGCPKVETLPHREPGPAPVIAISTHWPGHVAPEAGSAWQHFGAALLALGKRWTVLGHGHPRTIHRLLPLYRRAGIDPTPSFEDVCRRADVYVCDNSSSLFEFAATGRPVVVLNPPSYRRSARHGLRFWDAAGVGVNVDRAADIGPAIERALELRADDVAAREAALDIVYQPRTGSTKAAADALREWAAEVSVRRVA